MQNIGFVGLGAMGSEMAPLLSKAGYNVFGFDIKKKIDENTGVVNVENIESLIDKDVIIYMLPDFLIYLIFIINLPKIMKKHLLLNLLKNITIN